MVSISVGILSTKEFGGNSYRFGGKPFIPQNGGWAPEKGGCDPPFEEKRGSRQNKHSLRVGWRNFFPVVLLYCVSFWFWQEIGFGLNTYVLRVPYSCGAVSVFLVLVGNSFWYIKLWCCASFFGSGRK